jgi:hypothetical protein
LKKTQNQKTPMIIRLKELNFILNLSDSLICSQIVI